MARLSTCLSRYFSLSSLRSPARTKLNKRSISHPVSHPVAAPDESYDSHDTAALLATPRHTPSHTPSHSQSSTTYALSDAALESLEKHHLARTMDADIDDLIAAYARIPRARDADADLFDERCAPGYSVQPAVSSSPGLPAVSSSPVPRSTYPPSPHPPSQPHTLPPRPAAPPARIRARLEIFADTPPPAPGWATPSFGRETVLFGPRRDGLREERGGAGRGKDWRAEFGRRGYALL